MFTILSLGIGNETNPTRIAANIVTGIGFLGAGAIMRDGVNVTGLTTAATIWLAASLGMDWAADVTCLSGLRQSLCSSFCGSPAFEHWIDNIRETRNYEISLPLELPMLESLPRVFGECGVKISGQVEHKIGKNILLNIYTLGKPANHKNLVKRLMKEKEIVELRYNRKSRHRIVPDFFKKVKIPSRPG